MAYPSTALLEICVSPSFDPKVTINAAASMAPSPEPPSLPGAWEVSAADIDGLQTELYLQMAILASLLDVPESSRDSEEVQAAQVEIDQLNRLLSEARRAQRQGHTLLDFLSRLASFHSLTSDSFCDEQRRNHVRCESPGPLWTCVDCPSFTALDSLPYPPSPVLPLKPR